MNLKYSVIRDNLRQSAPNVMGAEDQEFNIINVPLNDSRSENHEDTESDLEAPECDDVPIPFKKVKEDAIEILFPSLENGIQASKVVRPEHKQIIEVFEREKHRGNICVVLPSYLLSKDSTNIVNNEAIRNSEIMEDDDKYDSDDYAAEDPFNHLKIDKKLNWMTYREIFLLNKIKRDTKIKYGAKESKQILKGVIESYLSDKNSVRNKNLESLLGRSNAKKNSSKFNIQSSKTLVGREQFNLAPKINESIKEYITILKKQAVEDYQIIDISKSDLEFLMTKDTMVKRTLLGAKGTNLLSKASTLMMATKTEGLDSLVHFQSEISYLHFPSRFSKWISSQFNFIKDLDIRDLDGNCIISNIYPQNEFNIPVRSEDGLYYVKLYFLGEPRLIQVDDKFPCNVHGDLLFPTSSSSIYEIWPLIIVKAFTKLFSSYFQTKQVDDYQTVGKKADTSKTQLKHIKNPNFLKLNSLGEYEIIGSSLFLYTLTGIPGIKFRTKQKLSNLHNVPYIFKDISMDGHLKSCKLFIQCLKEKKEREKSMKKLNIKGIYSRSSSKYNSNKALLSYHGVELKNTHQFLVSTKTKKSNKIPIKNVVDDKSNQQLAVSLQVAGVLPQSSIISLSSIVSGLLSEAQIQEFKMKGKKPKIKDLLLLRRKKEKTEIINTIRSESMKGQIQRKNSISVSPAKPNAISIMKSKFGEKLQEKSSCVNIEKDYGYCLIEFFNNSDFNMDRLNLLNFNDLRQIIADAKVPYKLLDKTQKIKYLMEISDLKFKQKTIMKQRIDNLRQRSYQVYFFKILVLPTKPKLFSLEMDFSEFQIEIAKVCIFNNESFPALDYYEKLQQQKVLEDNHDRDNRSRCAEQVGANSKLIHSKKTEKFTDQSASFSEPKYHEAKWHKEIYTEFVTKQEMSELKPLKYNFSGQWLNYAELFEFDWLIFFYKQCYFKHELNYDTVKSSHKVKQAHSAGEKASADLVLDEDDELALSVVYFKASDHPKKSLGPPIKTPTLPLPSPSKEMPELNLINANNAGVSKRHTHNAQELTTSVQNMPRNSIEADSIRSKFVLVFQSNSESFLTKERYSYYLNLELYNKQGSMLLESILLKGPYCTYEYDYLFNNEDYLLIKKGGFTPFGYTLRILSDHETSKESFKNYYINEKNYSTSNINLALPKTIPSGCLFILSKAILELNEISNIMLCISKIKPEIRKQIKVTLVNLKSNTNQIIYFDNFFCLETGKYYIIISVNLSDAELSSNLFLEGIEPTVSDKDAKVVQSTDKKKASSHTNFEYNGIFQLIASSSTAKQTQIQMKDHIKIIESKICLDKRCVIFQELLEFKVNPTHTSLSLDVLLYESSYLIGKKLKIRLFEYQLMLYGTQGLIKEWKLNNKERFELVNLEMQSEDLICSIRCVLLCLVLNSDSKDKSTIVLKEKDLTHFLNNKTISASWRIISQSSSPITCYKDTTMRDEQEKLIANWEKSNPGRKDNAEFSRFTYSNQVVKQESFTQPISSSSSHINRKSRNNSIYHLLHHPDEGCTSINNGESTGFLPSYFSSSPLKAHKTNNKAGQAVSPCSKFRTKDKLFNSNAEHSINSNILKFLHDANREKVSIKKDGLPLLYSSQISENNKVNIELSTAKVSNYSENPKDKLLRHLNNKERENIDVDSLNQIKQSKYINSYFSQENFMKFKFFKSSNQIVSPQFTITKKFALEDSSATSRTVDIQEKLKSNYKPKYHSRNKAMITQLTERDILMTKSRLDYGQ